MDKPTIFICYHQKDLKWKDNLEGQLNVLMQQFDYWDNEKVGAGEDMLEKFNEALGTACVAIFLVSSDSLSPQFILREDVKNFIARRKEGLRVIPLIVRDCGWEQVDWLVRLKPLPKDKIALRKKKPADVETELKKIVTEVAEIIKRLTSMTSLTGSQIPGEPQNRAPVPEPSPKADEEDPQKLREKLRKTQAKLAAAERELELITKATPTSAMPSEQAKPLEDLPQKATGRKPQFLKD